MTVIPCVQNASLRTRIEEFSDVLLAEAHKLGNHGLDEREFYNSGLFRGAIERIRGQFSASMSEKREFVRHVLNYMQDQNYISDWASAGEANRHDYSVVMPSGRVCAIELKGCLDGNNTTIFERPQNANEFLIWSVCTNPGADPRANAWSGIHTRLSAEIISRQQRVDGLIIWDMVCGTLGRPCPKILSRADQRVTTVGPFVLPPPCIYMFPGTVASARNNPHPVAQRIDDVQFLDALHRCFLGEESELSFVNFDVEHRGADTVRKTTVLRQRNVMAESRFIAIRRT